MEMMPPVRIKFGRFEKRLARRIRAYERKHRRTPKRWEVIERDLRNDPAPSYRSGRTIFHDGLTDRRAFDNLVRMELILHSRNGHCWLTDKGKVYLRRAKRR
jgi:hypothetical protein